MRAALLAAVLLLPAPMQAAVPPVLVIGTCIYRHQSSAGDVQTFTHSCFRSDAVDEPVAVNCRSRKVAAYLDPAFIIPGRTVHRRPGWQPWEAPSDDSADRWLLIEAACAR